MITLRYALRALRQAPGVLLVAILSLALGIGANTAIFSLIDQILLRPLPVPDPDSLVIVKSPGVRQGRVYSDEDGGANAWSYPMYKELRDRNQVLTGLIARFRIDASLATSGQTERGSGELVSGNYFPTLGIAPALGRLLTPDDDRSLGAHHVAVLSHGYWTRRFGSDPSVLNQVIHVNGQPMTVVGVAARGFYGVQVGSPPDVFVPLAMMAQMLPTWEEIDRRGNHWMNLLGRLKPGVSQQAAAASLQVTLRSVLEADADARNFNRKFRDTYVARRIVLEPGAQGRQLLQSEVREPLYLLMAMVALVLLIACANVANLLLARGLSRARDIAVRLAIGASRARLVRQLLAESILLASAGGLLGVLVAYWTVDGLLRLMIAGESELPFQAAPDARILAFNFALALLTALVFGLLPALRSTRPNLAPVLKDQAASVSASASQSRLRKALIVAQVALTVLLLTSAGLFMKSLLGLRSIALGITTTSVVRFTVAPHLNGYKTPQAIAFHRNLRESLATLPGVRSAAFAEIPVFADSNAGAGATIEGYTAAPEEDTELAMNWISPAYFSTLGVPLISGREIRDADGPDAPKVGLINEATVRKYFKGRNPLGFRIALGKGDVKPDIEIVGVVADSRHGTVRSRPAPFLYVPFAQKPRIGEETHYVRAALDPVALMNGIRDRVRRLDPNVPVVAMRTLDEQIAQSIANDRLITSLAVAFAVLAALLASLGIYGVMAYGVTRRTREIGIRVALGAVPSYIRNLILREVLLLTAAGIVVGLPAALALGRYVESMLYGVKGYDPVVAVAALTVVALVAFAAGYLPARRATRIDPLVALRYE